jgi:hypothetical protein
MKRTKMSRVCTARTEVSGFSAPQRSQRKALAEIAEAG